MLTKMRAPVVDLKGLDGSERSKAMAQLKDAAENWGFFQIVNHGMPPDLIEKVKRLTHEHHDRNLQPQFDESELARRLRDTEEEVRGADWETVFFVQHLPTSNAHQVPNLSHELLEVLQEYEGEMVKLAERMLDLFCENLGLEEGYLKKAFCGPNGRPFMGTKFARYPSCPKADRIHGLRAHYDAGGIILLLQDDHVPGLQFSKGGEWVDVEPLQGSIFVNTGDQLEVLTNGRIRSIAHRVIAQTKGGRISIASFYNPASGAIITPAPKLLYPEKYIFNDYMNIYHGTKFAEKQHRLDFLKECSNKPLGEVNGLIS